MARMPEPPTENEINVALQDPNYSDPGYFIKPSFYNPQLPAQWLPDDQSPDLFNPPMSGVEWPDYILANAAPGNQPSTPLPKHEAAHRESIEVRGLEIQPTMGSLKQRLLALQDRVNARLSRIETTEEYSE
jgi:hypothetical protein